MINEHTWFRGEYYFLSNFYQTDIVYDNLHFTSAEAAFQSAKTTNFDTKLKFTKLNPSQAKALGRSIKLREDWEDIKDKVMYDILHIKFGNYILAERLVKTGDAVLVENNDWGDTYWGVDKSKGGLNKLGQILMQIREEKKQDFINLCNSDD